MRTAKIPENTECFTINLNVIDWVWRTLIIQRKMMQISKKIILYFTQHRYEQYIY